MEIRDGLLNQSEVIEVCNDGEKLLNDARYNKGSAFTSEERKMFALEGLLPPQVWKIEDQVAIEYEHMISKNDDLEKLVLNL